MDENVRQKHLRLTWLRDATGEARIYTRFFSFTIRAGGSPPLPATPPPPATPPKPSLPKPGPGKWTQQWRWGSCVSLTLIFFPFFFLSLFNAPLFPVIRFAFPLSAGLYSGKKTKTNRRCINSVRRCQRSDVGARSKSQQMAMSWYSPFFCRLPR